MTLGFTWYTFFIFSPELWRTATFKSPHQPNYWDFKGLHSLSWAQSDGFDHIQAENGFGLWQHFHQPDPSGAVWVSGCGEFFARHRGRGILPGQTSPQGVCSFSPLPHLLPLSLFLLNSRRTHRAGRRAQGDGRCQPGHEAKQGLRAARRLPASCNVCSGPCVYLVFYLPWYNRGAKTVKLLFRLSKVGGH